MAISILSPGVSVRCASAPLTMEWNVDGMPAHALDLRVERQSSSGDGQPVRVRPLRPGQLLIPVPDEPLVVIARPVSGHVFPDSVFLELRFRTPTSAEYVLSDSDLSGTPGSRLASIAPGDGVLVLTAEPDLLQPAPPAQPSEPTSAPQPPGVRTGGGAAAQPPGPSQPEVPRPQQDVNWSSTSGPFSVPGSDGSGYSHNRPFGQPSAPVNLDALPGLAKRTAYAARRQVDAARLPASQQRLIVLAIDRSASMLPVLRSGAVDALLEVLIGLSAVVGRNTELPVWQLGATPRPTSGPLLPTATDSFVDRELREEASITGTVLAPLAERVGTSEGPTSVFVVTDGSPPDLEAFRAAVSRSRRQVAWHLIAFARSTTDPQVRAEPWTDELVRMPRDVWASVASITPSRGDGWLQRRLEDPTELETLVADLFDWPARVRAAT